MKLEVGKYYEGVDGKKYGPVERISSHVNHPWQEAGYKSAHIWESDGTSNWESDPDLVAEWVEEPVNTKCKAEEAGYKKVRVTEYTLGWPVGYIGWLEPGLQRVVWDDDLTKYFYQTLGMSCEYVKEEETVEQEQPKLWKDMTPEEKGALLLAYHEGETIEVYDNLFGWEVTRFTLFAEGNAYRVKPKEEPKRETVELYGQADKSGTWLFWSARATDTHKITFDTIDGKPDCSSIQMEELD